MRKKIIALLALVAMSGLFTGCNAVQGYSVRSFQGSLPMNDYQFLASEANIGATR